MPAARQASATGRGLGAVQGLTHRLNVQLQEGREAVVEKLDLAFAEHADEIGGPELA